MFLFLTHLFFAVENKTIHKICNANGFIKTVLSFQANNALYNEHFPTIFSRQANLLMALGFEGFTLSLS